MGEQERHHSLQPQAISQTGIDMAICTPGRLQALHFPLEPFEPCLVTQGPGGRGDTGLELRVAGLGSASGTDFGKESE